MTAPGTTAIHATALVVREAGVVIRGPSGAGKSRLALLLLDEARRRGAVARRVAADRVLLRACAGGIIAAPHPAVAGLLERRTQVFGRLALEQSCLIRLVVDLHPPATPLPRYPDGATTTALLPGSSALPLLRLQGPPDALSCGLVLEAIETRLNTVDGP